MSELQFQVVLLLGGSSGSTIVDSIIIIKKPVRGRLKGFNVSKEAINVFVLTQLGATDEYQYKIIDIYKHQDFIINTNRDEIGSKIWVDTNNKKEICTRQIIYINKIILIIHKRANETIITAILNNGSRKTNRISEEYYYYGIDNIFYTKINNEKQFFTFHPSEMKFQQINRAKQ